MSNKQRPPDARRRANFIDQGSNQHLVTQRSELITLLEKWIGGTGSILMARGEFASTFESYRRSDWTTRAEMMNKLGADAYLDGLWQHHAGWTAEEHEISLCELRFVTLWAEQVRRVGHPIYRSEPEIIRDMMASIPEHWETVIESNTDGLTTVESKEGASILGVCVLVKWPEVIEPRRVPTFEGFDFDLDVDPS